MFDWFTRTADNAKEHWSRSFTESGLLLSQTGVGEPVGAPDVAALVTQLEDEGFATPEDSGWLLPWDSVYDLLEHSAYRSALEDLQLPPGIDAAPRLESHGSLTDHDFGISVSGWAHRDGRKLGHTTLSGPLLRSEGRMGLLPRASWNLLKEVRGFIARSEGEHNELAHRRTWGRIRRSAVAANAQLDDFLYKTVVLTPERLTIGLRKVEAGGTKVVEVAPSFEGCPDDWLKVFDRLSQVQNRYDVPTKDGIVQVIATPQVKAVLQQIKSMPGRRVAGTRAEAFVSNPFAALGQDASEVIDPEQFDAARAQAGLLFERFTAYIKPDAMGYPLEVGVLIESAGNGALPSKSHIHLFETNDDLEAFIRQVRWKLDSQYQVCLWEGYEFELLGDTGEQLDLLAKALEQRRKPPVLVSYAQVHDLSAYSARVDGIGIQPSYYSAYIVKKENNWFPENLVPVISWPQDGDSERVAVPLTPEASEQLSAKVKEAKAAGQTEFTLSGFPRPMPVVEAEDILVTVANAFAHARAGTFDPARSPKTGRRDRPGLVIKANIQSIDYAEARRDILLAFPETPALPTGLRPGVQLKDHQKTGLAWLQHLFTKAPDYCRGAVLADDMGLGKTLQLLALMARAFEDRPNLEPALVVAPVSLLENWKEEAEQFFQPGVLRILTAYGENIAPLRAPRASVDAQLQQEGLVKFLKPGWRGNAHIVLTTYETLRDFEFSFAAERWSLMVCDEAQKIKNPNAMLTRAAKKQNVQFKIACTGTPVENTLADLWCLFDFVQPGMLGALNDFGQRYRKPIEAETHEERLRVEELRERIKPQLLRRIKAEVAKDLPKKLVDASCQRLPMSSVQRALYAQAVEQFRKRNDPGARAPFRNHLGLLHYLRALCTDPRPYGRGGFKPEPLEQYRKRSPKLNWLLTELEDIKRRNEKAIIFCEFRDIQRLLSHYIEEVFGFAPDIINGDTSASASHSRSRQKRIKAFQAKAGFGVIILSPVAVGFGVNIQEANHVIHYTRTWNPAKEDQATDRAYRIGQTKDVYVYYPVVFAEDFTTFDVKLDQLLQYKRALAEDMLNGSGDVRPGDFALDEVVPGGAQAVDEMPLTLDDALRAEPDYFECLVAALWQKKGHKYVIRTPDSHDDGVDVVAITRPTGDLVQCKSSTVDDADLGWDAIKDVVTGEAAYNARFPGVRFRKACVTNQHFNDTAKRHAELNEVELYNQDRLAELLQQHPVTPLEVERFLVTDWDRMAA